MPRPRRGSGGANDRLSGHGRTTHSLWNAGSRRRGAGCRAVSWSARRPTKAQRSPLSLPPGAALTDCGSLGTQPEAWPTVRLERLRTPRRRSAPPPDRTGGFLPRPAASAYASDRRQNAAPSPLRKRRTRETWLLPGRRRHWARRSAHPRRGRSQRVQIRRTVLRNTDDTRRAWRNDHVWLTRDRR